MLKIVDRILKMSGKHRKRIIFSFFMSFLESAVASVPLFATYIAFSWIAANNINALGIIKITALLFASTGLRYIFKLMESFQSGVGYEIIADERLKLGKKLLRLPMGFYSDVDAGNISSVLANDLVFVESVAMSFLSKVVGGVFSGIITALFMFLIDRRVALIACTVYPLVFIINRCIQRIYIRHSRTRQEAHSETSSVMLEHLEGIFVIKNFNLGGKRVGRLESILKNLEIVSLDFEMKAVPWIGLYLCCFHIGTALILGTVAFIYAGAGISLSSVFIFVIMSFSFYAPAELIGLSSGFIRLMDACLDRMQSIMDYPLLDEKFREVQPKKFDVAFNDVHFSYGHQKTLNGISFVAPEKTLTAIVGPSGSGKSTILNLIARFWDIQKGNIKIGGVDIKEMNCDEVMKYISIVFQKAYLFHDTVFNNIKFGNPNATREQVMEAAKKSYCHEFIMKMKNGYDTEISERGSTLSGGERQRITIARALLKDAPIVLLDEVTSNIDPENEMQIRKSINALVREKTVFVVAHKLTSIKNAHRIIVLGGDGTIRELGTHKELLNAHGLYEELWNKSQKIGKWTM